MKGIQSMLLIYPTLRKITNQGGTNHATSTPKKAGCCLLQGRSGPLWDDRYKARLLETSDEIETAIDFVHCEKDIRHIPDFDKETREEREHKRMSIVGYDEESKTATTADTNDSLLSLENPPESDEAALNPPNSIILYRIVTGDKTLYSYFCMHDPGSYIFLYERVGFRAYKAKQGIQLE